MPVLTSNRLQEKKTKPSLSYPDSEHAVTLSFECSWWVRLCSIADRKRKKREGSKILNCVWMLCYCEAFSLQKHAHPSLLLTSVRPARADDIRGIGCPIYAAICSSSRRTSPGDRIHMSPATHSLLLSCSLIWISHHMCVNRALSWLDKSYGVCVSYVCVCVRSGLSSAQGPGWH